MKQHQFEVDTALKQQQDIAAAISGSSINATAATNKGAVTTFMQQ